jgi:hypothetical protein
MDANEALLGIIANGVEEIVKEMTKRRERDEELPSKTRIHVVAYNYDSGNSFHNNHKTECDYLTTLNKIQGTVVGNIVVGKSIYWTVSKKVKHALDE